MTAPTPLRRVLHEIRPEGRRIAAGVALGFLTSACAIGLMATSAYLLQAAARHPPVLSLTVIIVAVRFFGLAKGALRYAERLVSHDAALGSLARLRLHVYEAIEPLAPGGLVEHRSGDLLHRLVADVDALRDLSVRAVGPLAVAAATSLLASAVVAAYLPLAGLLLALGLVIGGAGVPLLARHAGRAAQQRLADERGAVASETADLLRGGAELAAWGAARAVLARIGDHDDRLARAGATVDRWAALLEGLAVIVAGASVTAVLATGTAAARTGFDALHLGLVTLAALAAFDAVAPLPVAIQALAGQHTHARRVYDIVDQPPPVREPDDPRPLPPGVPEVRLEGVTVRYRDRAAPALAGLDLELLPGRRIALVGPSGSGKSTAIAVLARFVAPTQGRLTIGGVDARAFAGDDVRTLFALAGQDSHVFATSIRENVRIGQPTATDAQVDEVLSRVRLDGWLAGLPEGADTVLGDDAARASGGQRQRIVLARALLSPAPYLLLDEPTVHVDDETAGALIDDILADAGSRGVVLVTHRSHGLDAMDEIIEVGGNPRQRRAAMTPSRP